IFRRQMSITEPNSPVAVQRDAPHGAILWPPPRISKKALHEAICDPPVMRQKGKVDVNERIGCVEPLPRRRDTVIAINDPPILLEEVRVNFQILLVRDLAAILLFRSIAACSELDCIQRIERQPSYGRQTLRKRRFSSARISKDGDLFHGACSRSPREGHSARYHYSRLLSASAEVRNGSLVVQKRAGGRVIRDRAEPAVGPTMSAMP